jgi:DNA invertase Pin-like site-specific DNA recombinase
METNPDYLKHLALFRPLLVPAVVLKNIAAYYRRSKDNSSSNKSNSIDKQQSFMTSWAKKYGYRIAYSQFDIESGTSTTRTGLLDVIAFVANPANNTSILVVYRVDRLYRDIMETLFTLKQLKEAQCSFTSTIKESTIKIGPAFNDPEYTIPMLLLTAALIAQDEAAAIRMRIKDTLMLKSKRFEGPVAMQARFGTYFVVKFEGRSWDSFFSSDLPKKATCVPALHNGEIAQAMLLLPYLAIRKPMDLLLILRMNGIDINYRGEGPLTARRIKENMISYVRKEKQLLELV